MASARCSAEMDKLTTLEGVIGCPLSTWNAPEVSAVVAPTLILRVPTRDLLRDAQRQAQQIKL